MNPFQLSEKFLKDLDRVLDLKVPENADVFMDYHMNWIYAALHWNANEKDEFDNPAGHFYLPTKVKENPTQMEEKHVIEQNQEDVDLLIAYQDSEAGPDVVRVILIEAKADTSWSTSQFRRKARRLHNIFGCSSKACKDCQKDVPPQIQKVIPSFVLVSPALKNRKRAGTNSEPDERGFTKKLLNWPSNWDRPKDEKGLSDIPDWFFVGDVGSDSQEETVNRLAWIKIDTCDSWKTVSRTGLKDPSWNAK